MTTEDRESRNRFLALLGELTRESHVDVELLFDYVLNQFLQPIQRAWITVHLAECPDCAHSLRLVRELMASDSYKPSSTPEAAPLASSTRRAYDRLPIARLVVARTKLAVAVGKIVLPSHVHAILPSLAKSLRPIPATQPRVRPETYQAPLAAAFGSGSTVVVSDLSKQLATLAEFLQSVECRLVQSCASLSEAGLQVPDAISEAKKSSGAQWPDSLDSQIVAEFRSIFSEGEIAET